MDERAKRAELEALQNVVRTLHTCVSEARHAHTLAEPDVSDLPARLTAAERARTHLLRRLRRVHCERKWLAFVLWSTNDKGADPRIMFHLLFAVALWLVSSAVTLVCLLWRHG
jgi:uncharacterized protein involved in exopolysaccharide biosynthesis